MSFLDLKENLPRCLFFCDHILYSHQEYCQEKGIFHRIQSLDKGNYGTVYASYFCCQKQFTMAVKVIPKSKCSRSRDYKMLSTEVAILRYLSHPNVVHFYDFVEVRDEYLLLMEYVSGTSLYNYLEAQLNHYGVLQKWPIECFRERILIFQQIVQVALYLQEKKIIHRDWKLENILYCTESKQIKVCDFGMSTYVPEPDHIFTRPCGSPHYVSPEVLQGSYTAEPSTTWSLGIILYGLLTCQQVFNDDKFEVLLEKIIDCDYQLDCLTDFYAFLPAQGRFQNLLFQDLMMQMLHPNPQQRITLKDISEHPFLSWKLPPLLLPRRNHLTRSASFPGTNRSCKLLSCPPPMPQWVRPMKREEPFVLETLLLLGHETETFLEIPERAMYQQLKESYQHTLNLLANKMPGVFPCLSCGGEEEELDCIIL